MSNQRNANPAPPTLADLQIAIIGLIIIRELDRAQSILALTDQRLHSIELLEEIGTAIENRIGALETESRDRFENLETQVEVNRTEIQLLLHRRNENERQLKHENHQLGSAIVAGEETRKKVENLVWFAKLLILGNVVLLVAVSGVVFFRG